MKYHNKKTKICGIVFDSKKEASRFMELEMLQRAGKISALERQKRFEVVPKTRTERAAFYVADFVYVADGRKTIEDVKSAITKKNPVYVLKKKLVKYLYPEYDFVES